MFGGDADAGGADVGEEAFEKAGLGGSQQGLSKGLIWRTDMPGEREVLQVEKGKQDSEELPDASLT